MAADRITQLRISGMRVIDNLSATLREMSVLIGDNGVGKSTILEALELLRQAATPGKFVTDVVVRRHGGLRSLLRRGQNELKLGVTIETRGNPDWVTYDIEIINVGNVPVVSLEALVIQVDRDPEPIFVLARDPSLASVRRRGSHGPIEFPVDQQELALTKNRSPECQRVIDALSRIQVFAPFETRPLWQHKDWAITEGPRRPDIVVPTVSIANYAKNLPNAFHELRNRGTDEWNRVLEQVRLGLGDDFREILLKPFGRGDIELQVVWGSAPDQPMPAADLSEGQISYLAFVALCELHNDRPVLAIDEPELHLHPALLARVVWMLEEAAEKSPVIVATHSDRFLDALENPADSVVLCELDENRALKVQRPNPERLKEWLERYRGIGSLRAEGYESHVFARPDDNKSEPQ